MSDQPDGIALKHVRAVPVRVVMCGPAFGPGRIRTGQTRDRFVQRQLKFGGVPAGVVFTLLLIAEEKTGERSRLTGSASFTKTFHHQL